MDCQDEFFTVPRWDYKKLPERDVPTDRDIQRALRVKEDIDEDVYFLDCQVAWLQNALEHAQRTLQELLPYQRNYTGVIKHCPKPLSSFDSSKKASARNGVPVELWLVIFQEILKSTEVAATLSTLQTLSLVCKSWKSITDNSPGLWTRFQPTAYEDEGGASPNAMATALRRSKNIPLDITLGHETYDEEHIGIIATISSQTGQLHLEISDEEGGSLESKLGPLLMQLSQLRRLSVNRWASFQRHVFPGRYFALSPLTSLSLDFLPVETDSMPILPSVRDLVLRGYGDSYVDRFLRRCPDIVTLQVLMTATQLAMLESEMLDTHICHSLHELTVGISVMDDCWTVLGVLHAPALQKLKFEFTFIRLPTVTERTHEDLITQFFARSSHSLVSLSLEDKNSTASETQSRLTSWSDKMEVILNAAPLMLNLDVLQIMALDCHALPAFIEKMTVVTPDLIILPRLTQISLAILEHQVQTTIGMLRARALSSEVSSMKVIDLRVYSILKEYGEHDHDDHEEASEMDSSNTIARLEEWRRSGATVSCYAHPRFTHLYDQE